MLTEEEWSKREKSEGKLLLTRKEWMKNKEKPNGQSSFKGQGGRDKRTIKWVYDDHGTLVMKVQISQNRLYKLIIKDTGGACLLTKNRGGDLVVAHMHLGHVNFKALSILSDNNKVYRNRYNLKNCAKVVCYQNRQRSHFQQNQPSLQTWFWSWSMVLCVVPFDHLHPGVVDIVSCWLMTTVDSCG